MLAAGTGELQEIGTLQAPVLAMQWSPDGEVLALLTAAGTCSCHVYAAKCRGSGEMWYYVVPSCGNACADAVGGTALHQCNPTCCHV